MSRITPVSLVLLILSVAVTAYENRSPGQLTETQKLINSPHGRINRLALGIYASRVAAKGGFMGNDDPVRDYQILPLLTSSLPARRLTGDSVVRCGMFYENDTLSSHGSTGAAIEQTPGVMLSGSAEWMRGKAVQAFNEQKCRIGDKTLSFSEWLTEAGYTADEPELWMSLRHFYDPISGQGITDEHYLLAAALFKVGDLVLQRPKMDARTWALRGQAQAPFEENHWSWENGIKTMAEAVACTSSPQQRDRLYAKSWRALGETMHLMADMTVPAHVRNDAHAYKTAAGSLGPDPYEVFATEQLIGDIARRIVRNSTSPYLAIRDQTSDTLRQAMDGCRTPDDLFKTVASWTNSNFFSADTVSGTATVDGKAVTVHNANATPDFPSPKLEDCILDSETVGLAPMTLYARDIDFGTLTQRKPRRVYMARLTWAVDSGWLGYFRTKVQCRGWEPNIDVCLSQAQVLIPLAIYANTYLVDWYIPRFKIELDELDIDAGKLGGRVVHIPYGAHQNLTYNLPGGAPWAQLSRLVIDGKQQSTGSYALEVRDGVLSCDFSSIADQVTAQSDVRVYLDLGGIWMRSQLYKPQPPTGYWVQENVRIDTRRFWKENTTVGPFTLTSTWEVTDETRLAGEYKQTGQYSVDIGEWAAYSIEASGELNWQPLPKVIAASSAWEIHVTGSAGYTMEPDNETVRLTARECQAAEQDSSTDRTPWTWFYCPDYSEWWSQGCKGSPQAARSRKHQAEGGTLDKTILLVFRAVPEAERAGLPKLTMTYQAHTPMGYQNVVASYVYYEALPMTLKDEWATVKASKRFKGVFASRP
jgi:hypothetical protein